MKKLWILLLTVLMLGLFAGCGGDESSVAEKAQTVTVEIPRDVLAGQSDEDIMENAKNEGVTVHIEDDGTVTYTMTPEQQQALLLGFKTHFEENVQTAIDNGQIPGLVNVTYNDEMNDFTVTVNREQFQTQEDKTALGLLYSAGTTYQLYAGTPDSAIDVTVTLVDQETGDAFDTYSMRDAFSAQQAHSDNAD